MTCLAWRRGHAIDDHAFRLLPILAHGAVDSKSHPSLTLEECRALHSYFLQEEVGKDDLLDQIEALRDERLVTGDDPPSLTPQGEAVLEGATSQRLGDQHAEQVESTVWKVRTSDSDERQEMVEAALAQVRSGSARGRRGRRDPRSLDSLRAVAYQIEVDAERPWYELTYTIPLFQDVPDAKAYRILSEIVASLQPPLSTLTLTSLDQPDTVRLVSPKKDVRLDYQGRTYTPDKAGTVDPTDPTRLESLVRSLIDEHMTTKAWVDVGDTSRYTNLARRDSQETGIGRVDEYDSLHLRVDVLGPGEALVWVDEEKMLVPSVASLQEQLEAEGEDRSSLERFLEKAELKTLPKGTPAPLEGIEYDVDMETTHVDDGMPSFYSYWRNEYGLELERRFQPVLTLDLGFDTARYPAETVYPHRFDLQDRFGTWADRRTRTIRPGDRMSRLEDLRSQILPEDGGPDAAGLNVEVGESGPSLTALAEAGWVEDAFETEAPHLVFGGDQTSTDTSAVFEHGPHAGRVDMTIPAILAPRGLDGDAVLEAVGEITSVLGRAGFASVTTPTKVLRYDPADEDSLRRVVSEVSVSGDGRPLAFAVLAPDHDVYHRIKQLFEEKGLPVQGIAPGTVQNLSDGPRGTARNLALKAYTKVLDEGEAVWVLDDPSDGADRTLYTSLAYSDDPRGNFKEARCASVMSDAYGREVRSRLIELPRAGRTIEKEWFAEILDALRGDLRQPRFDRVLFHREGDTYGDELKAIAEALDDRPFLPDRDELIATTEERRRVVDAEGPNGNPKPGTVVKLGPGEALVFPADAPRGTSVPLRLSRHRGSTPIEDLAVEYIDQTQLQWGSPGSRTKHTLASKIANKMASMASRLPPEKTPSYYSI